MQIRRAQLSDVDAYHALVHDAYQLDERLGVHFAAARADRNRVLTHLARNPTWLLVDGNEPLAAASLRMPWGPNPGPWSVPHYGWIVTRPERARQGLARRVMGHIEQQVLGVDLLAPAVSLGTATEHPWLGQAYLKLGFRLVKQVDLGLGHLTDYYLKALDPERFAEWTKRNPTL